MQRWRAIGSCGALALGLACGGDDARSLPSPGPPGPAPNGSGPATATDGGTTDLPSPTSSGPQTGSGSESTSGPSACDPFDPATCALNERCSPVDGRCYPDGNGDLGAACSEPDPVTGLDSCRRGSTCAFSDDEGARCVALCDPTGAPCEDGVCVVPSGSALGWCLQDCAPFAFECNRTADGCYPMPGAAGTVTACAPVGVAEVDESCAASPDCQRGFACTAAEVHASACLGLADSCCAALCNGVDAVCFGNDLECLTIGLKDAPAVGVCGTTPP